MSLAEHVSAVEQKTECFEG